VNEEHIVVLIGSASDPLSLLRSAGAAPLGEVNVRTTIIVAGSPQEDSGFALHAVTPATGILDRASQYLGLRALGRLAVRSPIGRLLNSLSPADQSKVFYRAVRADQEAQRLISTATLLIAADAPAARTAWAYVHSGRAKHAVYTLEAARRHLSAS